MSAERSSTQRDLYNGPQNRGTIPQSVHFESNEERINALMARVNSLPHDSKVRDIIVETLRRDYGVTVGRVL